jgi:UDP:flavonoid glycosyltransferase YjiC (YdhE family)
MPFPDPATPLRWAEEIASALSRRVVLVAGFTPLTRFGEVTECVFAVRSVNHDWLMPRCCVAVHHGGAGTVQASLGAGLPTLVVSVFADQPFWGAQLARLGVGSHIPFRKASGARIAAALGPLLGDRVRACARAVAEAMAQEDGARVAACFLEENAAFLSAPER